MPAAKEKISFQLVARFMALLLLLAATAALAQARSAVENRVWQKINANHRIASLSAAATA